jgi:glycosyltransferase involved in cell wall biosynthesis/SAM-dependent methyltransferase
MDHPVAFFSPLPPAKSGIADYSAALLDSLRKLVPVEAFTENPRDFDPSRYGIALYQLGNNPYHTFAYEAAMKHPGVVVLHEANLHHLIAELTIRRKNWPAYLNEVELNAGPEALAYAKRYVETLERGPDYEIPMLRSILSHARGVIVHSRAVRDEVRAQGYPGPVAVIPHGAWIVTADRMAYRTRLGLDEQNPLVGIFGFLKPYKRIAEALRAFRRVSKLIPALRMILVGEAHQELPLDSLISAMNLSAHVRHLDFVPIEDFNGYLGACDIVLNLRYPTVGESSGTLLRALGMGKAVVVSNVGSFREFPDDVVLKAPVDATEEEHLFEYLNLLASRPEIARELGVRARAWVERECRWDVVARRYLDFLEAVAEGRASESDARPPEAPEPHEAEQRAMSTAAPEAAGVPPQGAGQHIPEPDQSPQPPEPVAGEYITSWAAVEDGSRAYVESHLTRLEKTLAITPRGTSQDRVLEMGAYLQITPALKTRLGYGEVRGCYYGPKGASDRREVESESGETFQCEIDLFDAEKDCFPYPPEHFSTVLCCELLEHLPSDPMHMMGEINRILKPDGHLVLTTPNIASLRALAGILQGFHPMLFPAYIRPKESGEADARHAREYTAPEIKALLEDSGFEVTLLETGPFREAPKPEFAWVEHLLDRYLLTREHRGDGIYAVGRKIGPVRDRYPVWLYS